MKQPDDLPPDPQTDAEFRHAVTRMLAVIVALLVALGVIGLLCLGALSEIASNTG